MSSRLALEPAQPPMQWVPGTLSPGVKRQGSEADHSPPGSAEMKKTWVSTFQRTHFVVFIYFFIKSFKTFNSAPLKVIIHISFMLCFGRFNKEKSGSVYTSTHPYVFMAQCLLS
jgi:hypothetical protein